MMIYVTPATGKHVRNPDTGYQPLPPEGAWAQESTYWRQLQRFGDVAISTSGPSTPTPASE